MSNRALWCPKTGRTQNWVSHETAFGEGIRSGAGGSEHKDTLPHSYDNINLRACGNWAQKPGLLRTVPENGEEPARRRLL